MHCSTRDGLKLGIGFSTESPAHASRKQALAVLTLLEKRPGVAPSALKAQQLFKANIETLRKLPDPAAVISRAGPKGIECNLVAFYQQASLLLKDIKALPLEKRDAQRVRRLAMDYIKNTGSFFSLLKAGVMGSFLENFLEHAYTGANREDLLARAKAYSKGFEAKRQELEIKTSGKNDNLGFLAVEYRINRELYAEFAGITKELAPAD